MARVKLRYLFLLFAVKQLLWTAFIPLWQFPDEQAHFAQVQNIAEGNQIGKSRVSTSKEVYTSEQVLGTARDDFGNNKFTYHPEFNIEYALGKTGGEEEFITSLPISNRKELVINEATGYPPLYYQLGALLYKAVYGHNLLVRVFFTRLINLPIYLLTVYVSYQIGKLLFLQSPLLQVTLASMVAMQPMYSFLSAGTNSDNLFTLFFTIGIYLGLLVLEKGLRLSVILMMIVTVAAANVTKPQGIILPLVFIYPFIFRFVESSKQRRLWIMVGILILVSGLGATLFKLITQQQFVPELPSLEFLPTLSLSDFLHHLRWTLSHTYREVMPWYWGVFRWLSLTYPRLVHRIINWVALISLLGLLPYLYNLLKKKHLKVALSRTGYLVYVSGLYFGALTVFDYLFNRAHGFSFGIQGRYLFPTIVAHMAVILIGATSWIHVQSRSNIIPKLMGVGATLLHFYALYYVVTSYFYPVVPTFFLQASQYKPDFFKSPWLETYTLIGIISVILWVWYYLRYEKEELPRRAKSSAAMLRRG